MLKKCQFYIPPFILIAILMLSYFLYIYSFLNIKQNLMKTVIYFVFLNIFFILLIWSFLSTMLTAPALVPEHYKLTQEEEIIYNETMEEHKPLSLQFICENKGLDLITRTSQGHIRFCKICEHVKPDRAHHCSKCKTCILRMDHHCPWLKNCIGFSNHKHFMLTLFYCTVYCFFYLGTAMEYFMDYWTHFGETSYLPLIVGFFGSAFFGATSGMFFVFHFNALLRNQTNMENMYPIHFLNKRLSFSLEKFENFKEIFGNDWRFWLFPSYSTKGNGIHFSVKTKRRHKQIHPAINDTRILSSVPPSRTHIYSKPLY